ncbi:ATP-dependent RecD-like DNA helicase [Desulfatiferula olefinivorans]
MAALEIRGELGRIRFRNEDNQYTVADFHAREPKIQVTVVGFLVGVRPGDALCLTGAWEKHGKFGRQFKIDAFEPLMPDTLSGIKAYLKALDIPGLSGKKIALLVRTFEEKTLEVIDTRPESLTTVPGIGKVLSLRITEAWGRHNDIGKLSRCLQSLDLPASFCARIHRRYQAEAVDIIRRSPYTLALDFPDLPFALIDQAASRMGLNRNDPQRVSACLLHLMNGFAGDGHVYVPQSSLIQRVTVRFGIDKDRAVQALDDLADQQLIKRDTICDDPDDEAIYLTELYRAETRTALTLTALNALPSEDPGLDEEAVIEAVLRKLAIKLSDEQLETLQDILSHRVSVITGGPGTGKTTLIRSVAAIARLLGKKILLAAPTGRAARRLAEVTGEEAATIHKMLDYNIGTGRFDKNRYEPLDVDVLIVDEASMIDIVLMSHLVSAVPFRASLILVGDIFQLPSVGPGTVLADLIESRRFRTFELTRIFRQAEESPIIRNAHLVRQGKPPEISVEPDSGALSEFYFIETAEPLTVMERIVDLCARRIPEKYRLDPFADIQVLTPMHKGEVGTLSLNSALQQALNPDGPSIDGPGTRFRKGDKVMHLKNNYEKEVANGDIGIVGTLDKTARSLTVTYFGREVAYSFDELHELTLAYAVTVHKSQGSEYPAVVVPITFQHRPLLQRNLLYTAMTRGRNLVILIGTRRALTLALSNDRPNRRRSALTRRLTDFPS